MILLTKSNNKVLLALAIITLFILIGWNAVVMEDPYITFRVVDNVVRGYGLRWNLDERVQPYTHPLWMLLHIPFYALWRNIFFITLLLSLVCTGVAILLPIKAFKCPPLPAALFFILPLLLSKSFLTYSTSGFENSLSHALFACFAYILLDVPKKYYWFYLSLFTALSLTNRADIVIFYAPIWIYLLIKYGADT